MNATLTKTKKVGDIVGPLDVISSETGTPDHLRQYAADVCGASAITRAVNDLFAGHWVEFARCERKPEGSGAEPRIVEIIRWQVLPGASVVRYCGEGGNPDGAGSHTLHECGSVYDRGSIADLNAVTVAAAMGLALGGQWFFRLNGPTETEAA